MFSSLPQLDTVARPKQARSERTLHGILDAAEALIEERGSAEVSVPEIVRRAGCSVGGFYGRFRDKNELLRALEERFFGEQRDRVAALAQPRRWGDAPVPEVVRVCAGELVRIFRERRALIRAFVARAVQDAAFRGEALGFRQDVAASFAELLHARGARFRHPTPRLGIELGVAFVFGAMVSRVLFSEVPGEAELLPDDAMAEELARNFLGYLGVEERPHRRSP